jgi:hypothetical protein
MELAQLSYKNGSWSKAFPKEFDSPSTLAFVFFKSSVVNDSIWDELKSFLPQSILLGCSGAGEIKKAELMDDEVVVTLSKFENTKLHYGAVDLSLEKDSEKAGEELSNKFPKEGIKALYVLSDGLHVNGTGLIKGIRKVLGDEIVISGGLAGDGTNFKETYVLVNGKPSDYAITAVAFYGDNIHVVSSANGGWRPFGPLRVITKSTANVVFEFDHKPALDLYKEFLGDQAKNLPSSALMFPIHLISGPENNHREVVRTILAVDETNHSMTFAGDVPVGTSVQLMRSSQQNLIDAALEVAKTNASSLVASPQTLSLIVSCVGRRLVLGENTDAEIESVYEQLPPHTIQTGFYSYGEIAPGKCGFSDLHNQTMTVTLIQEKGKRSLFV